MRILTKLLAFYVTATAGLANAAGRASYEEVSIVDQNLFRDLSIEVLALYSLASAEGKVEIAGEAGRFEREISRLAHAFGGSTGRLKVRGILSPNDVVVSPELIQDLSRRIEAMGLRHQWNSFVHKRVCRALAYLDTLTETNSGFEADYLPRLRTVAETYREEFPSCDG